ncbi:DNA primase [Aliikangiella sp. G2MR2-5]|uniref:DNA primase n=1 Tax=Aliikangiella sp. G2MR2-5 TaxID=2788943 RepID=UPI0018AA483C|nr:DNA primase [Aliikangiella sp. G2MR2-5]
MAGRIPQTFLNELLARTDLVEVIDRRVPLKKAGRNYSACCPFHNEKTPSFSVNPDKQFYYCFGCGASGNALTFLMEYEGQDFVAAVEDLAGQQSMDIPRESGQDDAVYAENQQLFDLMEKVADSYQQNLKKRPLGIKAVEYLKQRGLSGEIAKLYGIGYVPGEWQNLQHLGKDQLKLQEQLVKTGMMIRKDNGHAYDRFRDRIMFPIRNRRGQVLGFGGRVIDQGEPKYLNSPETTLFHKGKELYGIFEMRRKLRDIEQIIIVEGYMDVVALAQYGIYNSVATLGTATTSEHLQTLFRICHTLVFCFDGDRAGRAAALRALNHALPQLKDTREVRLMFLPDGEDPDSMVRAIGMKAFNERVESASTLFDYLIEHLTSQVDMNTFEGPAKLVHLAKPFAQQITDPILLSRFTHKIAELSGLADRQLEESWREDSSSGTKAVANSTQTPSNSNNFEPDRKFQQNQSAFGSTSYEEPPPSHINQQTESRNKAPFRRAIALLLQHPEALPPADMSWLGSIEELGARILLNLIKIIEKNEEVTTAILVENWRGTAEHPHLIKLANQPLYAESENINAELSEIFKRLEKNYLLDQWDSLLEKVRNGSVTAAEKEEMKRLQAELSKQG